MATKTTKRVGETATTVSVGIRIDPKVKFALDIMGREQKRSLTAVIEWAIGNAISQQKAPGSDDTFAALIDKVWSTDEPTRLANMAFYMPSVLTYDELRLWETVTLTEYFWTFPDAPTIPEYFNMSIFRSNWDCLKVHVERYKNLPSIKPYDPYDEDNIVF
ncbi:hypothetical protein [Metapseudomonas otitidis]|uniref:Uncharacterized protein n=1 Tax=Metapseudomonas otitidis TaxID=319939 RepID=A0A679GL34_9GAMM|nr:hypothetical protein [Pseudomonas otitidis]BCA30152.1 hypothetical protein PtoMrB4_41290 [Pseudomonas otitidis]